MAGMHGMERLPVWADGIPHAEHEETGFSNTHGPTHTLDGYFPGVVLLWRVDDLTVIVVVA